MQYFLKKMAKTLDKYVLNVVSLLHQTNTNTKNIMKTKIFKSYNVGIVIISVIATFATIANLATFAIVRLLEIFN